MLTTIELIQIDNSRNTSCVFPTFYFEDGTVLVDPAANIPSDGCKASDFDQYGDLEAFGVHPDWMRQLTKFASVQDRLREWQPVVLDRLIKFSCLAIKALDFDAIRIDKATQVTVDPLAAWATGVRKCAAELGKNNFFISGEVTGGNTFGSLYL
jgi:alpha-1,3-glucan synthase